MNKPYGNGLLLGLAIIWLVTAFDVYCCQWLVEEQNPIAACIIANGGLWLFISVKIIGTALATEWMRQIHWGYLATISVLYLLLAFYLYW